MDLPVIGALWIGGSLTWLERLCLASFVKIGHPTVLFTYEPVEGVPEGVEVRDGRTVLETDNFVAHQRTGSVALFSDLFRFHMVAKNPGMIWVDTDIYCHRPIDFGQPHVFGYETPRQINGAVLGFPPDSEALGQLLAFTEDEHPEPDWVSPMFKTQIAERKAAGDPMHVSELPWGIWGPLGVTHFLKKTGEDKWAKPMEVYYPVHYRDRNLFFKRPLRVRQHVTAETRTLHIWARIKKFSGVHYDGLAPDGSWLKQKLTEYDIDDRECRIVKHGKLRFDQDDLDAEARANEEV